MVKHRCDSQGAATRCWAWPAPAGTAAVSSAVPAPAVPPQWNSQPSQDPQPPQQPPTTPRPGIIPAFVLPRQRTATSTTLGSPQGSAEGSGLVAKAAPWTRVCSQCGENAYLREGICFNHYCNATRSRRLITVYLQLTQIQSATKQSSINRNCIKQGCLESLFHW